MDLDSVAQLRIQEFFWLGQGHYSNILFYFGQLDAKGSKWRKQPPMQLSPSNYRILEVVAYVVDNVIVATIH